MSGEFAEMQKTYGQKKFAESITMDAANRAMEAKIRQQLLKLADPSAVIVEEPLEETSSEAPAPEDSAEATPVEETTKTEDN